MKTRVLLAVLMIWSVGALAQPKTPINNGILQSDLNGNQKSITNLLSVKATTFIGDGSQLTGVATGPGVTGQTNWPVSAVTNAGTAAYSNASAFELTGSFARGIANSNFYHGGFSGYVVDLTNASGSPVAYQSDIMAASGGGVISWGGRTGIVTMTRSDVTNVLTGKLTNSISGNADTATTATTASGGWPTQWAIASITNIGTAAYSNATAFYLASNPSSYVTAGVTNGLATTQFVNSAVSGFSTNGLATTQYVNSAASGLQTNLGSFKSSDGTASINWSYGSPFWYLTATNVQWVLDGGINFKGNPAQNVSTLTGTNATFYGIVSSTNLDAKYQTASSTLPIIGGTVSGPIITTSATTNSPSATELATAGWVRNLLTSGANYYTTTNVDTSATNAESAGNLVYKLQSTIPSPAVRYYAGPLTNGQYIGATITTNTFTTLSGPITVNAYLTMYGGVGTPTVTVHPEIYYSYDKTNWLGDWDAQNQSITTGTNLYQWVVPFPTVTVTNSAGVYVMRRLKVGSVGGATAPGVAISLGTNTPSHITILTPGIAASAPIDAGVTNQWRIDATNALATASFAPFMLYGTNIVLDPTNGNFQAWTLTNASWVTVSQGQTNVAHSIRLDVWAGANALTWTTNNTTGTGSLSVSNGTANVYLLDKPYAANKTNLWKISQLQ